MKVVSILSPNKKQPCNKGKKLYFIEFYVILFLAKESLLQGKINPIDHIIRNGKININHKKGNPI